MVYLAQGLPGSEFDVRFILMSGRGRLAAEAAAAGATIDVLGIDRDRCRRSPVRCLPLLLRALRRYRALTRGVDIVDAWLVPAYTFAGLARPAARTPLLIAGRRSSLDVARTRTRSRELAGRLAMRQVDAVIANSRTAAREAIELEGIDQGKVHVVHNAVEAWPDPATDDPALRRSWGWSSEHVVVGCVGTLKPGKGQELLLDIASRAKEGASDLRFVLVGNGPLLPEFEARIEREGLAGTVRLVTDVSDARPVYGAMDICVQASHSEGLPNVVLEAAVARRAIVATDVGGTNEIVTNERDGILVERGDVEALWAAIMRLARDPGLRHRLGEAAGRRAEDFSVDALVTNTAALYRRLMGRD